VQRATTTDTSTDANAMGPKEGRINENIWWKLNGVIIDLFHKT
jgi:hypothetical protein